MKTCWMLLFMLAGVVRAQDPVRVYPGRYTVRLDNERVRVLELRDKPGDKSAMHSHPDYLVYAFGPFKRRFDSPDGRSIELEGKAGDVVFSPALVHADENTGTTDTHVLLIELKETAYRQTAREHRRCVPATTAWADGPLALPAGARMAVLAGDPAKPGPFTVRFKLPDGYKVPAHWHPADEHVTVVSGMFCLGAGDKFDQTQCEELPAGSFTVMPAGMRHFARTKGETVIQLHGIGPWQIHYVNPADDPRTPARQP